MSNFFKNKIKLNKFILIFLLQIFLSKNLYSSNSFVALGHLNPILNDKNILENLFRDINELDPDYIFILGDSGIQDKKIFEFYTNKFSDKIYFVPGNHEYTVTQNKITNDEMSNRTLEEYKKNVGYINKVIKTDKINFILLNSSDTLLNIKKFLKKSIEKNTKKIQIIMTHHRIWDDTLTSQHDKQHDKSYYFKDIYPLLSENINAIFAGNSKRQYFEDRLEPDNRKNSSLQNVNNIYWVDRIGEINAYSVGTGDGKPKLGYVFVKLIDGELLVTPYHIVTQGIDPVPITQIRKMKASIQPDNLIININFLKFIPYYYERISKKLMFLFGFFSAIFLILLLLIFKRIFISSNDKI